jgi:hypothetical protein
MDNLTLFGLFAVAAMLAFFLAFAGACGLLRCMVFC